MMNKTQEEGKFVIAEVPFFFSSALTFEIITNKRSFELTNETNFLHSFNFTKANCVSENFCCVSCCYAPPVFHCYYCFRRIIAQRCLVHRPTLIARKAPQHVNIYFDCFALISLPSRLLCLSNY